MAAHPLYPSCLFARKAIPDKRLINTAIIPLMIKPDGIFPGAITIDEGLEMLAKIVEGAE